LIIDEVSAKFHHPGHQNHESHGHYHDHNHADVATNGHTAQSVKDTVPHVEGVSAETLEGIFDSTGLLEDIWTKEAFKAEKLGTEYSFIMAGGKRK
jgi:hypothetical protein